MRKIAFFAVGAGLAALPSLALADIVTLSAVLAGAKETAPGDPDGSGRFKVEIDAASGDFCYMLSAGGIAKPSAAHLHSGAAGSNGPPVATLEVTGANGDMCIALEPDVLKPILANPAGYYVNVHTADFPDGAVRGQLEGK
jgi:CHRD domain